jgi:hypothetical protein
MRDVFEETFINLNGYYICLYHQRKETRKSVKYVLYIILILVWSVFLINL